MKCSDLFVFDYHKQEHFLSKPGFLRSGCSHLYFQLFSKIKKGKKNKRLEKRWLCNKLKA